MSGTDYLLTPRLGLYKPITDMDVDQWGTHWNLNADRLDTSVQYDAKGNVGISVLPPALQSAPNAQGGWIFAWGLTANNWAGNAYYDGAAWRYLDAGWVWQQQMTGGTIMWQSAPSGAKDAIATMTSRMTLDSVGNLSLLTGKLTVASDATINGSVLKVNGPWAQLRLTSSGPPANTRMTTLFVDNTNGSFGMQFVNDADNAAGAFFSVTRQAGWSPLTLTLTASNITLASNTSVLGYLLVNGTVYPSNSATAGSFMLYGDATYRYINFTVDNWRLLFNASNGNLSFDAPGGANRTVLYGAGGIWTGGTISGAADINAIGNLSANSGVYASNSVMGGGFCLYADANDCNIRFTTDYWRLVFVRSNATFGYWSSGGYFVWTVDSGGTGWFRGNLTAAGSMWTTDIHVASRTYTNDMMNIGGTFYVANNYSYYMQRTGAGEWIFVEGGTVNLAIGADGYLRPRAGIIGGPLYSYNNIHWGNDWAHILGNGAEGQLMQFAPSYYWTYNNSTGSLTYFLAAVAQWVIRNDRLCYNNAGAVGGYGFMDLSDERAKTDIEPAGIGLSEILRLEPMRFRYARKDIANHERVHLGFSAQQVRDVIPDAVSPIGIKLEDGSGGIDSDNPTLGLATLSITAALVNAVKEMHAEIQALKRAHA